MSIYASFVYRRDNGLAGDLIYYVLRHCRCSVVSNGPQKMYMLGDILTVWHYVGGPICVFAAQRYNVGKQLLYGILRINGMLHARSLLYGEFFLLAWIRKVGTLYFDPEMVAVLHTDIRSALGISCRELSHGWCLDGAWVSKDHGRISEEHWVTRQVFFRNHLKSKLVNKMYQGDEDVSWLERFSDPPVVWDRQYNLLESDLTARMDQEVGS